MVRMKATPFVIALCALLAAPAVAQQGPPDAGAPDMQQAAQARASALAGANAALAGDHQAKVAAIVEQVKAGRLSDARDAAKQIDAILTPQEAKAVLAARDKMRADLQAARGDAGGGGMPGGEPGGRGTYGGGRHGGRDSSLRDDAGFALLSLNLDRDQMRSLFAPPR